MGRHVGLSGLAIVCCWSFGCAWQERIDLRRQTGGSAFLFRQFQAFDGSTGRPLAFADLLQRCHDADVVLFGEEHADPICNQLEAQLLQGLANMARPLGLAMEFFELDTQAALDAYLTGRIDEPAFLKLTRQSSPYLNTHRPLIELSRSAHVPVRAANAPRRLVSGYRTSGLSYQDYRAGLDAEQRRWLPASSEYLEGPYRDRFAALMKSHGGVGQPGSQPTTQAASRPASQPSTQATAQAGSQPVTRPAPGPPASIPATMPAALDWQDFYRAQLLWDDAMAESVANFRDQFPRHRVLLVVGSFHVAQSGGTTLKLQQRRPNDRLLTIVYRSNPDGQFAFREKDRNAGDIVIYGLNAPKPERKTTPKAGQEPQPPSAQSRPPTATASAPTMPASQPATAPTTASAPRPATAPAPYRAGPRPCQSPLAQTSRRRPPG